MNMLSIPALRCGGPANLPYSTKLKAGPLTMLLEQGELRRIKFGNHEVIRRIYTSLRGPDWETIPAALSELRIAAQADSFKVDFTLTHQQVNFEFIWQVSIQGQATGSLHYAIKGRALKSFAFNRASLCLLHPLRECVGQHVRLNQPGEIAPEQRFPEAINPHQPFLEIESFAHEIVPGLWAKLTYTGESFEMEDQRNWSDGSFKTYSPPQSRPKPTSVGVGWETSQCVALELIGGETPPVIVAGAEEFSPCMISPASDGPRPIPSWGFGAASHRQPLGPGDVVRIKKLAPTHLRANFWLSHPGCMDEIIRTAADAKMLGVPVEAALMISDANSEAELADFAKAFQQAGGPVLRWLILSTSRRSTPPKTLEIARKYLQALAPNAHFVIGSNEDFVHINRNRPAPVSDEDLVFATSPQIHLQDNRTLVEALEGQPWALRSFSALWPKHRAIVSAITLKRSPLAAALKSPALLSNTASWRSQVDARQFSLLGAGWTLGSLKRMALWAPVAGLSATYFETTGLLGLMAGQSLGPEALTVPDSDLQIPAGWVYPLYHVFADFAEYQGGGLSDLVSNFPSRFDGALLSLGKRRSILLANLEESPGKIKLNSVGKVSGIRRLNEKNAQFAMMQPEAYRAEPYEAVVMKESEIEIELLPFEWIRLELE